MATIQTSPLQRLAVQPALRVLATSSDPGALIARIALGAVILPHGLQKTVGWFGGYGFEGTMGFFTGQLGLPTPLAALIIAIESIGALLLIAGVGGRLMAAGIAAVMIGAIVTMHAQFGFFMNWYGQAGGEGFEYHLLAIALAAVVLVKGSGAWSVDRLLSGLGR